MTTKNPLSKTAQSTLVSKILSMSLLGGLVLNSCNSLKTTNYSNNFKDKQVHEIVVTAYSVNHPQDSILSQRLDSVNNKKYPLKAGIPTSEGIEAYVEDRAEGLAAFEYERFVGERLREAYIYTNRNYEDENNSYDEESEDASISKESIKYFELGNHQGSEITLTSKELYLGYSLKTTKKWMLSGYEESNAFVRGVILHELGHHYVAQVADEMREEGLYVDKAFSKFNLDSVNFIEEGICEYGSYKLGEILSKTTYTPKNVRDLSYKNNAYNTYYRYSRVFVKSVLETYGMKQGIKILLSNRTPSIDEMLDPKKYYSRLVMPYKVGEENILKMKALVQYRD